MLPEVQLMLAQMSKEKDKLSNSLQLANLRLVQELTSGKGRALQVRGLEVGPLRASRGFVLQSLRVCDGAI